MATWTLIYTPQRGGIIEDCAWEYYRAFQGGY